MPKGRGAELGWSDLTLLPVIPDPAKILCIGLNYQKHKEETGRPDVDNPTIFTRFSDHADWTWTTAGQTQCD